MRVNTYALLRDKIEEGIRGGLMKCEKRGYLKVPHHGDQAWEDIATEEVLIHVMNAVCEYFDWEDEVVGRKS